MNPPFELGRLGKLSAVHAMMACHVTGLLFLPLMPILMSAIAVDFLADPLALGAIGSTQLSGTVLGAFVCSRMATRLNCRLLVLVALSVEVAANALSGLTESLATLLSLRLVAGFSEGVLLAAASAAAVLSNRTERVFVYYNVALASFAVLLLAPGAMLIQKYGHAGGYYLLTLVNSLALVLAWLKFPRFLLPLAAPAGAVLQAPAGPIKRRALLGLLLFGVAVAGVQTFIERLGELRGGSLVTVGTALAAGWCLAVFSPLLILLLRQRLGRVTLLVAGYLVFAAVALALSLTASLPLYLLAAALFTPLIMLIEPLQFGLLGTLDRRGQLAALGPAALSMGSACGPLLFSLLLGVFGLPSLGVLASCFIVLSLCVLIPLVQRAYKTGLSHSR